MSGEHTRCDVIRPLRPDENFEELKKQQTLREMAKKEAAERATVERCTAIDKFWEEQGQLIWLGKDLACLGLQFTTEDGRTVPEVIGYIFHRPAIKRGFRYIQTTYVVRVKRYDKPTIGELLVHISGYERDVDMDSDYDDVSNFSYGTEIFHSAKELVYTLWFR